MFEYVKKYKTEVKKLFEQSNCLQWSIRWTIFHKIRQSGISSIKTLEHRFSTKIGGDR